MSRISNVALATISAAFTLAATNAFAAQGPGIMPGTATPFTQTAMAIVVYGTAASICAVGLIGGLRRH